MRKVVTLNKASLVSEVCTRTNMSRKAVELAIESTFNTIAEQLAKGNAVVLQGFGTFSPQKRAARTGRNPHTNQPVPIPECVKPKFKASRELEIAVGGLKKKRSE